jgi:hypothetical protein
MKPRTIELCFGTACELRSFLLKDILKWGNNCLQGEDYMLNCPHKKTIHKIIVLEDIRQMIEKLEKLDITKEKFENTIIFIDKCDGYRTVNLLKEAIGTTDNLVKQGIKQMTKRLILKQLSEKERLARNKPGGRR